MVAAAGGSINAMNTERSYPRRSNALLLVAAVVLSTVSIAAWWPPTFIKKMTRPPLEAGTAAPQFELGSVSGETISLEQFEGKAVLLEFWSVG
jgi:cytochrome oxidase Cu insertion factor (SCO1/SenC/PrrC family)